jgi:hypothetical protein
MTQRAASSFSRRKYTIMPSYLSNVRLSYVCLHFVITPGNLHLWNNTSYRDMMHKGPQTKLDVRTERKNYSMSTYNFHHHKHQGLGHLARSVSGVTAALANVSSVSQLFSFLVDCSGMILKGFGFVAFCAGVKASSFCIHLSYLVCIQSVVCGVWSHLFYGH